MTEQQKQEETPEVVDDEKEPDEQPSGPSEAATLPLRSDVRPGISRRSVLQIGFWSSLGAIVAGTFAGALDMVYPSVAGGFGGKISVKAADIPAPGSKKEIPEGRFWLVNLTQDQGGPGLLALWWKCPHLGCTVPWKQGFVWPDPTTGTDTQGWYRCPCHGSTFTDAGVRVFGPAPRSLDTMEVTVDGDRINIDTGKITPGGADNADRAVRI